MRAPASGGESRKTTPKKRMPRGAGAGVGRPCKVRIGDVIEWDHYTGQPGSRPENSSVEAGSGTVEHVDVGYLDVKVIKIPRARKTTRIWTQLTTVRIVQRAIDSPLVSRASSPAQGATEQPSSQKKKQPGWPHRKGPFEPP